MYDRATTGPRGTGQAQQEERLAGPIDPLLRAGLRQLEMGECPVSEVREAGQHAPPGQRFEYLRNLRITVKRPGGALKVLL